MEPLIDSDAAPDVAGVGSLTCSCGVLKAGPASGYLQAAVKFQCPACGDVLEVWPDAE